MARKKKSKFYFTDDTQKAIIQYNSEIDHVKRSKLYSDCIHYPFTKLAENIINTFKFMYFDVSFEDLQHEVVAFLLEKIDKYDEDKGKAFSYFSIVAKNYLILNNNNNYKKFKVQDDLDVVDNVYDFIAQETINDNKVYNKEMVNRMVEYMITRLPFMFNNQRDITIADCVLYLFKNMQSIENFNKKSLYITIRQMTDAKTQQITKVINVMKVHYFKVRREYQNTGDINTETFFTYE